jgi:hypothetical protein
MAYVSRTDCATEIQSLWVSISVLVESRFPTILIIVNGLQKADQEIYSLLGNDTHRECFTTPSIILDWSSIGGVMNVSEETFCMVAATDILTETSNDASQSFKAEVFHPMWSVILSRPITKIPGFLLHIDKIPITRISLSERGSA